MPSPALDTDEAAARAQRDVWRRMGPERKLLLALQMRDDVRELAIAGEMRRSPALSRREAELVVIGRMLGDALFEAAYGGR